MPFVTAFFLHGGNAIESIRGSALAGCNCRWESDEGSLFFLERYGDEGK